MSMRAAIALTLFFALLTASPALAQEALKGFYLAGHLGPTYLDDSQVKSDDGTRLDLEFDPGYHYGLALGYDTGGYFSKSDNVTGRIEIEFAQRVNDVDQVEQNKVLRPGGGDLTVTSIMVNSWVDIETATIFVPYFGVGIGAGRLELDNVSFSDDDDTQFAYQIGGGVGLPVNNHVTLSLGYRYFATFDATLTDQNGVENDIEYDSHNIDFGLRYTF